MNTHHNGSRVAISTGHVRGPAEIVLLLTGEERQAGPQPRPKRVAYGGGVELVLLVAGIGEDGFFLPGPYPSSSWIESPLRTSPGVSTTP